MAIETKECPECGYLEYTPDCQYCNENRWLPDDNTEVE